MVGAVHYEHKVLFSSSVWREFKASTLAIIAECPFESETVLSAFHFLFQFLFLVPAALSLTAARILVVREEIILLLHKYYQLAKFEQLLRFVDC